MNVTARRIAQGAMARVASGFRHTGGAASAVAPASVRSVAAPEGAESIYNLAPP